jgi:hypothetical protein
MPGCYLKPALKNPKNLDMASANNSINTNASLGK